MKSLALYGMSCLIATLSLLILTGSLNELYDTWVFGCASALLCLPLIIVMVSLEGFEIKIILRILSVVTVLILTSVGYYYFATYYLLEPDAGPVLFGMWWLGMISAVLLIPLQYILKNTYVIRLFAGLGILSAFLISYRFWF